MSSTESSGAPAEATATTPAPEAAFPSFGSTRGSGLARGKRPAAIAAAVTKASSDYKPTAIEVVTAPREYQNPFAPAETPVAAAPEPIVAAPEATPSPAVAPVLEVPAAEAPAPRVNAYVAPETHSSNEVPAEAASETPASLNILEPMQPKNVPAQTWESEGFRPAREARQERPRREEPRRESRQEPAEPFDISSIPAKFLYVRPGYNYVPTPANYGGAPRDRAPRPERSASPAPAASRAAEAPKPSVATAAKPASSGGLFGWLKSLFGGSPTPAAKPAAHSHEARPQGDRPGGHNRHGRNNQPGGEGGQRRRHRGGRSRSHAGGQPRNGGEQSDA